MKSVILLACLIASATCAPQKSAGLERESGKKNAKLQFTPADAQVYSVAGIPETIVSPVAGQNVIVSARPQSVYTSEQLIPSVYGSSIIPGGYASGVSGIPYGTSVGKTIITTSTGPDGLPQGTVYEHHGQSHIGHLATAVHIRRPGQLYATSPVVSSIAGIPAVYNGAGLVNAAGIVGANGINGLVNAGAGLYTPAGIAGLANGQVAVINGQTVQNINGQLYAVDAGSQVVQQGIDSVLYSNPLNRPNVASSLPGVQSIAGIPTYAVQQPASIYNAGRGSVVSVRPAVQDNKWYTKTNTQQVVSPFFGQPQLSQVGAASAGTKSRAAYRPEQSEVEKNEW